MNALHTRLAPSACELGLGCTCLEGLGACAQKREIIIIIIIRPPPAWTVTKLFLVAGVSPLLLLLPAPLSFFTLGQGARSLCTMVSAQLPLLTDSAQV